ncbi:MAG: glycosyltransferase family 2 protein [Candidatus Brocadiae bacterium]|nr:glycosyltransferase family 2 protein [Candidatus Brocadiia bacterium]
MKNNTTNHPFTVVIPTRERFDTLEHSLRTCVAQNYENLEILVSDNFSQDRTREIVESYKDKRIRYINTGKRLGMTENYEFSLSHVKPEGYILYIGDDDGLLPDAIQGINTVVRETGTQVLRWDVAVYDWPTIATKKENWLYINSLDSEITKQDSASIIQNLLSFKSAYQSLPLMYMYSAVHYDIIKKIKDLSGKFYHSMTPDVYSGFAIAGLVGSFINSKRPYVIAGSSHHSTGASAACVTSDQVVQKFYQENSLPYHPSLFFSRSLQSCIIEAFFQAKDRLPFLENYTVDLKLLLFKMMQEVAQKPESFYLSIQEAVLQIAEKHGIQNAARQAIAKYPMKKKWSSLRSNMYFFGKRLRQISSDIRKKTIWIDCAPFGIQNIYDASLLCHHILKLQDAKFLGLSNVIKASLSHIKTF